MENIRNLQIHVDLLYGALPVSRNLKQGDTTRLTLTVFRGGKSYPLESLTPILNAKRADKLIYIQTSDYDVNDNSITYNLAPQIVAEPGRLQLEIELDDADGNIISSFTIGITVEPRLFNGEEDVAPDDQNEIIDAAREAALSVAQARDAAQTAVDARDTAVQTINTSRDNAVANVNKAADKRVDEINAMGVNGTVRFDEAQVLTDAQMTQARANVGAASAADVDKLSDENANLKSDLVAEQTAREEADNAMRADLTANANADAVTKRSLDALWKLNQGISYQFETDDTEAYSKTVPSGAKLASVATVGGKTLVWNQWVHPISSENVIVEINSKVSVSDGIVTMYPDGAGNYFSFACRSNLKRMANTKYYLRYTAKSSAWSQNAPYAGFPAVQDLWVTGAAVDKSVTDWQTKSAIFDGRSDGSGSTTFSFRKYAEPSNAIVYVKDIVVINLTMLYGYGNEPSSLDDPRIAWIEQYATEHLGYNAGDLVSADVECVKYNDAVVAEIPESVRNLPGYGWSAGDVRNSFERTDTGWQYVQRVGSRPYQEGDIVTDGITTYYALDAPVVTDITGLMNGLLDAIPVEVGGTLTFDNAAKLPVPSSVEYLISLAEVNG